MNSEEFIVRPVGYVRQGEDGMQLELKAEYRPALRGLAGFSHIVVLWWCHLADDADCRAITECEQPYRNAPSWSITAQPAPSWPATAFPLDHRFANSSA